MMDHYILITGGCGYIGSHLVLLLKERGYHLIVVDNLSTGLKKNMLDDVIYIQADIGDTRCLRIIFKTYRIHTVMHLAAKISTEESERFPELYYEENTKKTIFLMKTCAEHKIKHFFFSSTAAVYDIALNRAIKEDDAIHPISVYGKTKYLAEQELSDLAKKNNIQLIIFRYFNAAGHHHSLSVGNFNRNAMALIPQIGRNISQNKFNIAINGNDYNTPDGTCVRDYIHVMDIAHAHLLLLNQIHFFGLCTSEIINIGYGLGTSVLEIIHAVNAILGENGLTYFFTSRRPADIPSSVANNTKLKSLGWRSIFNNPIHEMIESEIRWCQTHFPQMVSL